MDIKQDYFEYNFPLDIRLLTNLLALKSLLRLLLSLEALYVGQRDKGSLEKPVLVKHFQMPNHRERLGEWAYVPFLPFWQTHVWNSWGSCQKSLHHLSSCSDSLLTNHLDYSDFCSFIVKQNGKMHLPMTSLKCLLVEEVLDSDISHCNLIY